MSIKGSVHDHLRQKGCGALSKVSNRNIMNRYIVARKKKSLYLPSWQKHHTKDIFNFKLNYALAFVPKIIIFDNLFFLNISVSDMESLSKDYVHTLSSGITISLKGLCST